MARSSASKMGFTGIFWDEYTFLLDEPSPGLLINSACHDHTQLIQRFENAD